MLKRKQYTKEFKLDAISLVMDQGLTIAKGAIVKSGVWRIKRPAVFDLHFV